MTAAESYSELDIQGRGLTSQSARDRLVESLRHKGITDERVLGAIASTPRHLFLDSAFAARAYEDIALPIGYRQTISQPAVVATMVQALIANRPGERPLDNVLEIGTGSGYNAAILAAVSRRVLSLERIAGLHRQAIRRLHALGLGRVEMTLADGGDRELRTRYDAIICTAGCEQIPPRWRECLATDGRLVVPVGPAGQQQLVMVERREDGKMVESTLGAAAFVPLLAGIES